MVVSISLTTPADRSFPNYAKVFTVQVPSRSTVLAHEGLVQVLLRRKPADWGGIVVHAWLRVSGPIDVLTLGTSAFARIPTRLPNTLLRGEPLSVTCRIWGA